MRRVDSPRCGTPDFGKLPWADSRQCSTRVFGRFLASWAKRLPGQDAARIFDTSWDTVHRAAGMAVNWERARINLEGVTVLGVDEFAGRPASAT